MDLPFKEPVELKLFDLGIATAFGLLHLLLYIFFPRKRANLFFSIFAFGAATRIFTADLLDLSRLPYDTAMVASYIAIWSIGFAVFGFVAFLYTAFEERFRWHFWAVVIIWTVLTATRFFTTSLPYALPAGSLVIIAFVAIESLRVVGRAIARKRNGAWIVALGVILIVIAPLYNALQIVEGGYDTWGLLATQLSLIGILVANSIFLARNFAQTNRDLELQLVQVRELSARELEHERTAADLRLQNEQERARRALVEQEIALAASIQQSLFPETLPKMDGYDIAAFNRPARDCGGDYYDVLDLSNNGDGKFLFCVADVSGKGLPASLLMSNLQASLRALASRTSSLAELAAQINDLLHSTSPPDKFVTAIIMETTADGSTRYVNAGHNECYLLRAAGEFELLKSGGLPLGMFPGMSYDEAETILESGDLIALFSDGVPEAYDKDENEWGEDELKKILDKVKNLPSTEIISIVITAIDEFASGAPQHDDVTLMILRKNSPTTN